jgi:hypothetical protein
VLGYVGDYLTNHVKSGDTRRTNNLVMRDCHDVLILGSSRARHHYDAPFLSDTLGLDVYNAGYDGNGVILAYGLLQLILERYQPKLILYDVTPAFDINVYEPDNNHKRYISRLKPYYRHYAVGGIIKDVSTEEWLKVQSGMVRYNMSLLTMFMDNYRSSNDTMKGYSPLEGVYDRVPNHDEVTSVVDSFKLEYIKKLITLTKNKQIPLVLVASPKLGSISSEQMQPVRDICKQTKVEFVDYYANTEFMQHNEWFKEPMHLNKEGARKYSKEMVSIILELLNNN